MALPIHPTNTAYAFSVPLTDSSGIVIDVATLTWNVLDEDGVVLNAVPFVTNVTAGATAIELTVPADLNETPDGQVRGVRVVMISLDGTSRTTSVSYMIENNTALVVMTNSFQTYERVLVTRAELGQTLSAFDAAIKGRQIAALETAYRKLGRIHYKYALDGNGSNYITWDDEMCNGYSTYRIVRNISGVSAIDFSALPEQFKSALRRAQIVEANAILGGDPITEKRMNGVISETVGESSMFLSNAKPLTLPVSRAAFAELNGFVYRRFAIARA